GWATLAIKKDEAGGGFPAVMDRLLRFAEYCNVGGGRNTGLGTMRYVPRERRLNSPNDASAKMVQ
ncbi:MAG: hypothetical protein Q6365_017100, partial [Candidatus Sigynarchaeota archaeon]